MPTREKINPFNYATEILTALRKGVLLTTQANGRLNSMAISWGFLGIDWNRPIFATLVRSGRFTYSMLEQNPEFTVNVPIGDYDKRIIAVCGTKSGRDLDKITELGLHPIPSEKISVPGILELPLTLECSVIYRQPQDPAAIPAELAATFHPQDVDSADPGANRDYHTVFYGAIVNASIIRL